MKKSLGEIAKLIDGTVEGDEETLITGVAGIKDAKAGDITFLANPKYLPLLHTTQASAIIVADNAPPCSNNLVRTRHPYLAFVEILKLYSVQPPPPQGIHPSAIIGENVRLAEGVALHAGVFLESGCSIGARSVLYPGVCVGAGADIGADCTIYPRVVVARNVSIGNDVIIHMGAVIGSVSPEQMVLYSNTEDTGKTVFIENDVEVGANVAIDGSFSGSPTVIGSGTKIDNLVHIGSGARVGNNCIVVSHSSIGADCTVGNGVTIAGQASILDGRTVGEGTIVAARSGVTEDIEAHQIVSGFPASNHEKWLRVYASMKRLPTIIKELRELEKRMHQMEKLERAETDDH
ncbi:MAG: UDP-3-O-(3-hydroxymyristoyl)glucosamine N-acyltransferase [Candidatus Abyssobacteria bacterium SURF_5]|uniref:UDP-3-O-(3-hydroxymyristoyl)glucosamine N-acyltransferase n=1 Tax=Abyssobacteria bacterium (strain SURF_5) TaxID=2093360 RepID=A0A3A4NT56_ABYX5|nr:MAG: UDP-3-O-(3-hydroxymyristoyl)glucosamine N-acyltransferase [Candidatus Abyssubacteria bacterium SURF_5]